MGLTGERVVTHSATNAVLKKNGLQPFLTVFFPPEDGDAAGMRLCKLILSL